MLVTLKYIAQHIYKLLNKKGFILEIKLIFLGIFMPITVSYHTEKRDLHAWKLAEKSKPQEPVTNAKDVVEFESAEEAFNSKLPEKYGFAIAYHNGFAYFCSHEEGWVKGFPVG